MRVCIRLLVVCIVLYMPMAYTVEKEEPIIVRLTTDNKLLPIYVGNAEADASIGAPVLEQLLKVLTFDLSYNGMTQAIKHTDETEKLAAKGPFNSTSDDLSGWKQRNIYYLVKVKVQDKKLSAKVVSVNNRYTHVIDDIPLSGDITKDRRQIHRLADAIHKALFNSPGVASTRFLYTIKKTAANDPEKVTTEIWEADYDGGNGRRILTESALVINPTYFPPKDPRASAGSFLYVTYKSGQSKIAMASLKDGQGHRMGSLPGSQLMPAVSPLRNQVAFISDTTSRPDLFVQDLSADGSLTGKPHQVFTAQYATEASPSYSPDGKRLAFVSNKDGSPQIYIIQVPPVGAATKKPNVTLLTKRNRENSAPAWSPDGTKIAYCAMTDGTRQIWIADVATGQERQVTQGPGNKENPTWAPDSLHLIFNSANHNGSELYLVNLNQPEAVKISSGPGEKRFPNWEPRKQ